MQISIAYEWRDDGMSFFSPQGEQVQCPENLNSRLLNVYVKQQSLFNDIFSNVCGPLRMNCNRSDDPLTFPVVPTPNF